MTVKASTYLCSRLNPAWLGERSKSPLTSAAA